ncbi:MAG: hydrogenase maturation protease [Solirubrobacterales bacterium]
MAGPRPPVAPAMRARAADVVVLGVDGACGDAEVGAVVVNLLRERMPAGVRLLCSAEMERDFAELDGATHVLVIDCVDVGREPGAVVLFDGDMLSPCIAQVTFRDLDIVHHLVLAGQHADAPEEIALLGVQSTITEGARLSNEVEAVVPVLVEEAVAVVDAWLRDAAPDVEHHAEPPDC